MIGVSDDEAPSILPTSAIVQYEMARQSFQEQTFKEEESTTIDNKSSRPENELQYTTQILEVCINEVNNKYSNI